MQKVLHVLRGKIEEVKMQLIERLKAAGHSCEDCAWNPKICDNPAVTCKVPQEICEWHEEYIPEDQTGNYQKEAK